MAHTLWYVFLPDKSASYLSLWASQVAGVVKDLPANAGDIKDVGLIPGSGRSLEEGMATHFSILAWRIPMDRRAWWATVPGVKELDTTEAT